MTVEHVALLNFGPEKGKVGTLLGKSFDFELNEERKSLQNGILGFVFRLSFNSRRKVRTVGCHKLIFWSHLVFTIMKMKKMQMQEVLGRKDMSVEKGRELDAVFATFTVDKKAKRLSSKMKAHLASQVDTSVENIQDYWLCYRRNNLKWVRRTVLFLIGQLCERNS